MKIAMVVENPLFFGGGEIHAFEISRNLAKFGHEVDFIQLYGFPMKLKFRSAVEKQSILNPRRFSVSGISRFFLVRIIWFFSFLTIPIICRTLINGKYDVVHLHGFGYSSPLVAAVVAKRIASQKIVCTLHNDLLRHIDRKIVRLLISNVDAFIAVSPSIQQSWINCFNVKPLWIPNGVDSIRFNSKNSGLSLREKMGIQDRFVVLSIGRLSKQKGIDVLLEAATYLKSATQNIVILVGGRGEEETALKKKAKNLGLLEIVRFVGFIPSELLPMYYGACDLFVLPSIFETFALTQLEALSSGKPIVVTKVGGAQEVARHFVSCFQAKLVEPNDPEGLAKAILWFVNNRRIVDDHKKEGLELMNREYSWETISKKINALYEHLRK
ncbi:glycosyltransferase family 4 protein [Candidatus Bathyarchaeota archaeon]|nr:glycosyltransferase family 4 protein [Candidatus Bathyarchaeota archaeon]